MTHNVFLVEGGTNEFIYVEEDTDKITAGLSFVNLSGNTIDGLTVAVELWDGNKLLDTISSEDIPVNKARNNISQISATYEVSKGQPDRAVAMLMLDGEVIDKIEQDIKFWAPKENPSFIYIEDGYFKKDGEIVNFFGVNYMPTYDMANEDGMANEHYVSAFSYDPDVILADEPTGNLDRDTQKEIMEIFRELAQQGKCVILVSHSSEVANMCDERYELTKIDRKTKKSK